MAIFVVRAWSVRLWGHPESFQTYAPPSTTPYFTDVASSDFGFPYVQKLKELGITVGCGGTLFCPNSTLASYDSTIFTVRARQVSDAGCNGGCSPGSFSYTASPAYFNDVPATNKNFAWIQRSVDLGIYSQTVALPNCSTIGNFCESAVVSRGQMAMLIRKGVLGQTTPSISDVMPNGITSIRS